MLLRAWYFVTVMLTALLMGTSFGHTLEMPAKMKVDGVLWMTFQHSLYPHFAYAGAPSELGAIIGAAGLAYLLRGRRPGFYPALVAAISLAAAFFIVWLALTNVANSETGSGRRIRYRPIGRRGAGDGNFPAPPASFCTWRVWPCWSFLLSLRRPHLTRAEERPLDPV